MSSGISAWSRGGGEFEWAALRAGRVSADGASPSSRFFDGRCRAAGLAVWFFWRDDLRVVQDLGVAARGLGIEWAALRAGRVGRHNRNTGRC